MGFVKGTLRLLRYACQKLTRLIKEIKQISQKQGAYHSLKPPLLRVKVYIAFLVVELFKILIYANQRSQNDVK